MAATLRRLGLLVPGADEVSEVDYHHYLPKGVVFYTARLKQLETAEIGTSENYKNLVDSAVPAARSVALAIPEIIVYSCTSGSFFKGYGWDRELSKRIESATGIPAITASTAVVDALHGLGVRKAFMITPYPDSVNTVEVQFLKDNGLDIVDSYTFDVGRSREIFAVTPDRIIESVLARRAIIEKCDALLISCTGLRAIDTVEDLEAELGVPVVTSNSASLWAALRNLKVDAKGVRAGRLFGLPPPAETSHVA